MIDWDKPIRQKNGRIAVFLDRDEDPIYPINVSTFDSDRTWVNRTYSEIGRHCEDDDCDLDLENIPEEK